MLAGRQKWNLILPGSPQQVPAWRWLLAEMAFAGEDLPTGRVDYYLRHDTDVRDAIELLEFWHAYPHRAANGVLELIELAHSIWLGPPRWDRCLLESRLLTGISTEEAAVQCRLSDSILHNYEGLFFDVSSRLPNKRYIEECAIGRITHISPIDDLMVAIRMFAYDNGPRALDDAIAAYANEIKVQHVRDWALHLKLSHERIASVRAAVESYRPPITSQYGPTWSQSYFDPFLSSILRHFMKP